MRVQERPLSTDSAQALAQHLRAHPEAISQEPGVLAESFGLPQDFVDDVLRSIKSPKASKPEPPAKIGREGPGPASRALRAIQSLVRPIAERPLLLFGTILLGLVGAIMAEDSLRLVRNPSGGMQLQVSDFGVVLILGCAGVLLSFLFAYGRAKLALMSALVGWGLTTPFAMVGFWRALGAQDEMAGPALVALALSLLFAWVLFGAAAIGLAVAGAYVRVRRSDRTEVRMSRQELLERMFEAQERLERRLGADHGAKKNLWLSWGRLFRRAPWPFALTLGFILNAAQVLMLGSALGLGAEKPQLLPLTIGAAILAFILHATGYATVGYFAGSAWKALALGALYLAGAYAAQLIPYSAFGPQTMNTWLRPDSLIPNLALATLLPLLAHAGAIIEEKSLRALRLQREEPSALLAEIVKLQWLLTPQSHNTCVMVVDAARSAEMKAGSDPLAVEYSFREYQKLIERLATENGGRIHNTAGDGAIVAFTACQDALRVAKLIQTEMGPFNAKVNKLSMPFRLRIGLHQGSVAGDLDKVQFTAVIDIAAHVQGAAPIGGIAVTESVTADLPWEPVAELRELVDGCKVFLVLNSTLDA